MALFFYLAVRANMVLVPAGYLLWFFRHEPEAQERFRENRKALVLLGSFLLLTAIPFFFWSELGLAGSFPDMLLGIIETLQVQSFLPLQYAGWVTVALFLTAGASRQHVRLAERALIFLPIGLYLLLHVVLKRCDAYAFEGRVMVFICNRNKLATNSGLIAVSAMLALMLAMLSRKGYWWGLLSTFIAAVLCACAF
ncbi:hypothetical protein POL68_33885 [Stigmatella sp. ncwal1]|uniref:Acyltransferase 3 domain-containing protein n=1 Tax=Stigmatella ashevillensis TaxID=2995309 RepID=A0ABT5DIL0_9BACT|nr:hypothetical protein [Stigmatella ashevillena]MDC0713505.1 hypothetical protein [Stigmatella ashevillena]